MWSLFEIDRFGRGTSGSLGVANFGAHRRYAVEKVSKQVVVGKSFKTAYELKERHY